MTAIAGIWRLDGKPGVASDCAKMLASLEIYGPHHGQSWEGESIALGRRLYRQVNEDAHDRQPVASADGRFVLVADMRLDNREELAAELGWPIGRLAQVADPTLLMACIERWGEGAIDRLRGEFAVALWDVAERSLILARDFAGRRPLYYHQGKGFFAFASMVKGLHALPDVPHGLDERAMSEFVALMPVGTRSFFKDIARVPPGNIVTLSPRGIATRAYWQPKRTHTRRRDYTEGLRHHFDQAVQACLRGTDGRVGAHLSAGLDSSTVTATAARLLSKENGRLFAFTSVPREGYADAAPRGRIVDEGPTAALTAALYPNIEHVLVHGGENPLFSGLDRHFFLFESPLLNPSNAGWSSRINQLAQERGLRVMLTGAKGNMSISYAGYELLPELMGEARLAKLMREAWALAARGGGSGLGIAALALGPFLPHGLRTMIKRAFGKAELQVTDYTAINPQAFSDFELASVARERGFDFSYRPVKNGFDMRLSMLRRVDGGNANKGVLAGRGIQLRDPTQDQRLVEYCLSVPTEEFLKDGVPRALCRTAFADRLPPETIAERRKGLQAADWHEDMTASREDIVAEIDRLRSCSSADRILDLDRLSDLARNMPSSGWGRAEVVQNYQLALLRSMSAGHFIRKATGSN